MKRHPFSMVEILLALGVVAIGICSVMVLFPVGAAATRDASMETYAANAADQILHMVKYKLSMYDNDSGYMWLKYICDASGTGKGIYKVSKPDYPVTNESDFDDTTKWDNTEDLIGKKTLKSGIFVYKPAGTTNPHFYQVVIHRGNPDDSFATVYDGNLIDFRAAATLWAEKVDIAPDLRFATKLNLELSWPVELPPSARQTAFYTLEVYNNQ